MTDLIDLNYYHRGVSSKKDSSSNDDFQEKKSIKICQIDEVIRKMVQRIDKNNIKTTQTYVFQIDCSQISNQDVFYNSVVKIIGMISLTNNIFSLRMQLFDVEGCKITVKSTHHRTLISNFVFQVNAQLQNYKVQYNPVFGEFAFVFNFKGENIQQSLITQLFQFGLHSYFQQCSAHFYILSLIEFLNSDKNQYLRNVQEHLSYLKTWIKQRKLQSKRFAERFQFYGMFLKSQSYRQKNETKLTSPQLNIFQIKNIEKYLIMQPKRLHEEEEMNSIKIRHIYKKFKKYYNSQDIFALNLANRARYQNLIVINTKNTKTLNDFLTTNRILKSTDVDNLLKQNNLQKEIYQNKISSTINSYYQKQLNQQQQISQSSSKSSKSSKGECGQLRLNICDKNTGKNYILKLIHLGPQNVKNEFLVLQKFCKFESYFFFNQYIELENYSLAQQGYIIVNANPKRLTVKDFLRKNHKIMSFGSKVKICLGLVQILLTFHLKSKISNYFPSIEIGNLQITRNLLISFKTLSKYSIYPLFEVCNTISIIFFSKPINQLKKNGKISVDISKGDQIGNKYYGLSSGTTFLKYYLLQLHIDAIQMINIKQLKISKKISMQHYPDIDAWSRQKLTRVFQQLLVIFSHYQSIFSKGAQQELSFGDDQSDQEI